jgi:hypothetical protein
MLKLTRFQNAIKEIIAYPKKGSSRRTQDGYPDEIIFDEFAYKRMVAFYRKVLKKALRESK